MESTECPFGTECQRSKALEAELVAIEKRIEALAARVRTLQWIVIVGWAIDFFAKNAPKAQAATLAFLGR